MKRSHFLLLATVIIISGLAISHFFAKNPGLHRFGLILAGIMVCAIVMDMMQSVSRMNEISCYTEVMKESSKKPDK